MVELLKAQCWLVWEIKTVTHTWVLPPGDPPGSHSEGQRNLPHPHLPARGGGNSHFEICLKHSVFLNKGLLSRKTILPEPTWPREGKYSTVAPSHFPVRPEVGVGGETYVKVTGQAHRLTETKTKLEDYRMLPSLPLTPHPINKAPVK